MAEAYSVEQHNNFAARIHLEDIGALLDGKAPSAQLTRLLDRYLVLHLVARQPITKVAMGTLGFALGFPEERRHQRGGRPGGPPCDTPGFEFIGDYGAKPMPAAGSHSRAPAYIEDLHY